MSWSVADLTDASFWWLTLIAVGVLTPITNERARDVVRVIINLGFVFWLSTEAGVAAAAGAVVIWLLLRGSARWAAVGWLSVALALSVFLLHRTGEPIGALTALGFGYVFLRVVDLSRAVSEKRSPAPSLSDVVNYLVPFHMLAAGPIQSWDEFASAPRVPAPLNLDRALGAAERIARGLFKKFVLAALLHHLFLSEFETEGWRFVLETQLFFLWLYLDFSAYSDIAVGVGKLIGVKTPENFNRPYIARNVVEFWERWHITLSLWVRRNLFIPLQLAGVRATGGRSSLAVGSIAFMIAFALCGLWHEVSLRFLTWGLVHGVGLAATQAWRVALRKRLGADGLRRYRENRVIRGIGILATYEFVALSLLTLFFP